MLNYIDEWNSVKIFVIILGQDMDLNIEECFGAPMDSEKMPLAHVVLEKHFGIL
jgi:hypothetical protein